MNVLHDDIGQPLRISHVEYRRDVWVVQLADHLGFLQASIFTGMRPIRPGFRGWRAQALDGHNALDGGIKCAINHAALTSAKFLLDPISPQHRAVWKHHGFFSLISFSLPNLRQPCG